MIKIKCRGELIDSGKYYYGILLSNKITVDHMKDKRYLILLKEDEELVEQINYLKNPKDFSHLKNTVGFVIPDSVGQFIIREDGNDIYEGDTIQEILDGNVVGEFTATDIRTFLRDNFKIGNRTWKVKKVKQ